MKKLLSLYRFPLLFVINTIPFALDVLFYSNGGMDNLYLLLPVFTALTALNYHFSGRTARYIMVQSYLLVCLIASGCLSTYLYYINISDDYLTPVVGKLLVLSGSVVVIITTVLTGIIKRKHERDRIR